MLWWVRFIFFSAVAGFFLEFGIQEMGRAYLATHPAEFLAHFFSSSFIILISGTLLVGFIWRMVLRIKDRKKEISQPEEREKGEEGKESGQY